MIRLNSALRAFVIAASICACDAGPPRVLEFAVSPEELPPGGGTVEVRWRVENAEQITLEFDGKKQEVPPSGTVRLDFSADADIVLRAKRDRAVAVAMVALTVAKVNVTGTVVSPSGAPQSGIEVRVNGSEPVVTGTDGRFAVPDRSVPYAVHVRAPQGSGRTDQLWVGMTDPEVTVSIPDPYVQTPLPITYRLELNWSGGGVNVPSGASALTHVLVFSEQDSHEVYLPGAPAASAVTITASIQGPTARDLTIVVMQGYVEEYLENNWVMSRTIFERVGRVDAVAADSTLITQVPAIALEPAQSQPVSLQLQGDSWLKKSSVYATVNLAGLAPLESFIWGTGSFSNAYELPLPPIAGALMSVRINADPETSGSSSRRTRTRSFAVTPGELLVVPLTAPPSLVLPVDNGEYAGSFAWERPVPGPCAVYVATFDGDVVIHTDRRVITANDIAHAGLTMKSSFGPSGGSWEVECPDGFASLAEAVADLKGYDAALRYDTTSGVGRSQHWDFIVP